jgi:hypothetical protein
MITLDARPDSLRFDPAQSALIVVDMQNAYATKGDISTWRGLMSPPPRR